MIEARLDPFLAICRHCDAQIVWAMNQPTKHGPWLRVPLDVDPDAVHEEGVWAVDVVQPPYLRDMKPPKKQLEAAHVTEGQARGMQAAGIRLYSHHALHCPREMRWYHVTEHGTNTRRFRGGKR